MITIPQEAIDTFRRKTFRMDSSSRLQNQEDAIEFVKERGFIFFWPITGILFPSLWVAKAGNRPVADNHDDPGHVTWQWKDKLLGSGVWYYAKILRKKATMIAPKVAPYFYALSNNFGSPEEDYLTLYEQGRLTLEEKSIYKVLLEQGALDTITLRKAAHLSNHENESRFNKALTDLQVDFKIAPIGVCETGGWNYAFVYDITTRAYPALQDDSRFIDEVQARKILLKYYFEALGLARITDVEKLFQWTHNDTRHTIQLLIEEGFLSPELSVENQGSNWLGITSMLK
jgi:hypothetical protein